MFQGRSTAEGRGWLQISPWPRFALRKGAEHVPEPMAALFPCSSHHSAYCCALSAACTARLLAQVAGDLFLGAEAAEHAERQDGDDEQQQETRYQRHAALAASPQTTDAEEGCSRLHVCTPARAMTWMTRSKAMVAGCPGCAASGLVEV